MPKRLHLLASLLFLLTGCTTAAPSPAPLPAPPPPVEAPVEETPTPVETEGGTSLDGSWWQLDPEVDGVYGAGIRRAWDEVLHGRTPGRTVVVAVLDSGVDIEHEDLREVIWQNPGENASGRDDDGNGLVDDLHGWNFIGGPAGAQVDADTYEVARLYAACRELAGDPLFGEEPRPEPVTAERCPAYEEAFRTEVAENEEYAEILGNIEENLRFVRTFLIGQLPSPDNLNPDDVARLGRSWTGQRAEIRDYFLSVSEAGITLEVLAEEMERVAKGAETKLNPHFDPRHLVGDDYGNPREWSYGNSEVVGPDPSHGTGVAGIIAAKRGNGVGIDGVTDGVRIMVLRTVPDGDERDKDVANSIRYAVDQGAHIINMSFGKGFSPWKEVVDEAVRYADEQGVLLVHAAGNSSEDLRTEPNFPTRNLGDGTRAERWLEVGASSFRADEALVATFSNYGAGEVDLFAPGDSIRSTAPENEYEAASGTSFAAPVVSGVAALLMAYYPELSAAEVREILLASVTPLGDRAVILPGTEEDLIPFSDLSTTGGIVNAYRAVRMAEERRVEREAARAPVRILAPAAHTALHAATVLSAPDTVDLSGVWIFEVVTENGTGTPTVRLQQEGERVTGTYTSPRLGSRLLEGTFRGDTLTFRLSSEEPGAIPMTFLGTLRSGGSLEGTVDFAGMGGATFTARRSESPSGSGSPILRQGFVDVR